MASKVRHTNGLSPTLHAIHRLSVSMVANQTLCLSIAVYLRVLWAGPPCFLFIWSVWDTFCDNTNLTTTFMLTISNYMFLLNLTRPDALHALSQLENAMNDVHSWLNSRSLKLNSAKSEFLLFGSKTQLSKIDINSISFSGMTINVSQTCRDLGVMLDRNMTMSHQISSICRYVRYQLRNIGFIRKYLNRSST